MTGIAVILAVRFFFPLRTSKKKMNQNPKLQKIQTRQTQRKKKKKKKKRIIAKFRNLSIKFDFVLTVRKFKN